MTEHIEDADDDDDGGLDFDSRFAHLPSALGSGGARSMTTYQRKEKAV